MKKQSNLIFMAAAMFGASVFAAPFVSAVNPYGIEYTGGEPLSAENVQIDPDLVEDLTTLMQVDDISVVPSNSERIQQGYIIDSGTCYPFYYVAVTNDTFVRPEDSVSFALSRDQYIAKVDLKNVVLDNAANGKTVSVGMTPIHSYLWGGYPVYSDAECHESVEGISTVLLPENMRIFTELNITLFKKTDTENPFVTRGLYFGLTDIDAAQSFKVLNDDNALAKGNMYALNEEGLQKQGVENAARNMYVESGHYIYSENYVNGEWTNLGLPSTANVYTILSDSTQEEGLDIVFGFAGTAASGIEYYASQLKVTYVSDENGEITGIELEKVIVDDNPSGTTEKPKEGYELSHWIADVDVKLEDGTTIKKGDPITSKQILDVVVRSDIEFTAIHQPAPEEEPEPEPEEGSTEKPDDEPTEEPDEDEEEDKDKYIAPPNTGASTSGEANAALITTSIIGIMLGALIIALLPRLTHKKLGFDK